MSKPEDSKGACPWLAESRDLTGAIRGRIDEVIELILQEELEARLGAGRYERAEGRRGYRNGTERRRVTTAVGTRELRVPRARLVDEEGRQEEWRSRSLPRYQRRCAKVDELILGCYLAGANTRRIRRALRPVLGEEHLSKSAVSRVVQRLQVHFEAWRQRDLSSERYVVLYLDATNLPVRIARRVTQVRGGVDGEGSADGRKGPEGEQLQERSELRRACRQLAVVDEPAHHFRDLGLRELRPRDHDPRLSRALGPAASSHRGDRAPAPRRAPASA